LVGLQQLGFVGTVRAFSGVDCRHYFELLAMPPILLSATSVDRACWETRRARAAGAQA
jgi:hypothetical protein